MPSNRRSFLKAAVGTIVAAPLVGGARNPRPNLLFILVDEWRAQATGYAGDPNARTPALDRLAAESANFENAVSSLPVCCPYRGSLMTGQYPLTNGVFINDVELAPTGQTLAQAFAAAGYRTGYIGKWHLFGSPDGKYGRRLAYIPPEKRLGFEYWKACECTHDYNHSLYYEGGDSAAKYWEGYDAIAQTDDACRFLEREAKAARPFFLFLSLGPPHFPYDTAPDRYRALYEAREIHLRPNVAPDRREVAIKNLRGYYAHIAALDECLGRLMQALEGSGAADDTVVVFTSDHGDMLECQGLTTKFHPWDESIRVPFLLRYPRKLGKKGRRIRTPLNTPDIMPTLLSVAGLAAPGAVQGADYSNLLAGGRAPDDAAAFLNLPAPFTEARRFGFAENPGLRTERYTYVRSIHGPWLLYDNQADPYQMRNLCGRSEHKEVQAGLDRALEVRLHRLNDGFLPAAEYLRRAGVEHYREVNVPVGRCRSPWGDWESTMKQE
jgi:arylsulfatase A-like enzyme